MSVADETPVLRVENLQVRYGNVVAASDVSLHVNRGNIVALLGPNGAGKTSVLRAIMGLVPPSGGTVEFFDGKEMRRIEGRPTHLLAKLGIANVPAQHVVLPRMTVEENLEVGGLFLFRDSKVVRNHVEEILEKFPLLRQRRKQYAGSLSGGEQRQLAIARTLISKPRLMLLDEPSLGLAPMVLADVFRMLKRINQEDGVDMLLVEQNVNKALEISDRAYVMRIGGIDFSGTSAELAEGGKLKHAYLGG